MINYELPKGISLSDIYGTTFTFSKSIFTKKQILDKKIKLRSKSWILGEDSRFWYLTHEERIYNLGRK